MARSRNIKPGFFTNEDLAELGFATRLLFAGLWTQADKAGRLEDRPKRLKMQLFPADSVDVDAMLQELHDSKMVVRYECNGVRYVCIPSWSKHQNPHHTEKASTIPGPNGEITVKTPLGNVYDTSDISDPTEEGGEAPVAAVLIPDSLTLIPDPLSIPPGAVAPAPPKGDASLESGNRAAEPAEPVDAPPPPAQPAATPVDPPGPAAAPAKPPSVFAAGAARVRAMAAQPATEFEPPRWVPAPAWQRWLDYRQEAAGGFTRWPFTAGEMKDAVRTLEKAMANKGTTATQELDATIAMGLRKPEYFSGDGPAPALPPMPPAPPPLVPRADAVLPTRPNRRSPAMHRPGDVSVGVWEQWCEFRRRKKAPVTDLVLVEVRKEADLAGLPLDDYLVKWLANGTTGFQAGYIRAPGQAGGFQPINKQAAVEARNAEVTDAYIKERFGDGNE